MIDTYFGLGALDTPAAFVAALVIGFVFGFALERAGFGSSRRLAGIFYFRDMTVLKVMFSGLVVAMLGLIYAMIFGLVSPDAIYFMPTSYGAQILGGLVFGVGFVVGGWCPGTAAVGVASGKVDAAIFLGGAVVGSIFFNEAYGLVAPLVQGEHHVSFVYDAIGVGRGTFALFFTLVAVAAFWFAETAEWIVAARGEYLNSRFLLVFSACLVALAFGTLAGDAGGPAPVVAASAQSEPALLNDVETEADHVAPRDLADRLMAREQGLVLVDVRPPDEFAAWHLPGALNVPLPDVPSVLAPYKNVGSIVLYSNGMTHPAQARDALSRLGFTNVRFLTDGLDGFFEAVLKPVSLRTSPLTTDEAAKVNAWRAFFEGGSARTAPASLDQSSVPGFVTPEWLAAALDNSDVKVVDARPTAEYNGGHIAGALSVVPENLRAPVDGVPARLVPPPQLAALFSLMGIRPDDTVVVVGPTKVQDATLVALAFWRMGHDKVAVLQGGMARWNRERRPVTTALPTVTPSVYPSDRARDDVVVDGVHVKRALDTGPAVVIDARPAEYFTGAKVDEARGGHIPGAVNRPFDTDLLKDGDVTMVRSADDLRRAYESLVPDPATPVYVHCRTGHQASQTYMILKHVLGYRHVYWYDGGWAEWAARPAWPVATK